MYKCGTLSNVKPFPDICGISIWVLIFSSFTFCSFSASSPNLPSFRHCTLLTFKKNMLTLLLIGFGTSSIKYLYQSLSLLFITGLLSAIFCSSRQFNSPESSSSKSSGSRSIANFDFNFFHLLSVMINFAETSSFRCSVIFVFTLDFAQSIFVSTSLFG